MAKDSYWDKALRRRITRRRALAATGGFAVASAFLAACDVDDDAPADNGSASPTSGGSSSSGSGSGSSGSAGSASSGLITEARNETSSAIPGGVFKGLTTSEPRSWDPHIFPNLAAIPPYGGLFRYADGVLQQTDGTIEPDVAESWEFSGDGTTLTAKINRAAHFSPLPPVNGRAVDANDVVFSAERHKQISNQGFEFHNEKAPGGPIVSVTAPDDETVVIQLNEPNAVILAQLGRELAGSLFIVPKEAADESQLDLNAVTIGTGPWYVDEWQPSIGWKLKKNPGFGQDPRGLPFIDEVEFALIQEYSAYLAQFRAGALYQVAVQPEDILQTKADLPELELMQTGFSTQIQRIGFGQAEGSPFLDERMRQAWMMTVDRELFLDTVRNVSRFAAEGIPIEVAWESGLESTTWNGYLLDPRDPEFGENAKYFEYNPEEAAKLISAVGHEGPVNLYRPAPGVGVPSFFFLGLDALIGLTRDTGLFTFEETVINQYFPEWIPLYHTQTRNQHDGVIYTLSALYQDPVNYLYSYYNPLGSLRQGTDDTLAQMTSAARANFDESSRRELVHDIQRYEGGKMFFARIGGSTGLSLAWPIVRNREVFHGGTGLGGAPFGLHGAIFLDPSKPPTA